MIKKVLFIFLLALMSQLIVACVNCKCAPARDIYFTNRELSLKNMDITLSRPMVTNAVRITGSNYGIQLLFATQFLGFSKQNISWGLMQSAYACSCVEDNFIAKEDVLSLKIFSNEDFDATHPKNTDLSLYFKAKKYDNLVPISEYIASLKDVKKEYGSVFYEGIFLQVVPKISRKHQFQIVVTLSDGRTLAAETTPVELI